MLGSSMLFNTNGAMCWILRKKSVIFLVGCQYSCVFSTTVTESYSSKKNRANFLGKFAVWSWFHPKYFKRLVGLAQLLSVANSGLICCQDNIYLQL